MLGKLHIRNVKRTYSATRHPIPPFGHLHVGAFTHARFCAFVRVRAVSGLCPEICGIGAGTTATTATAPTYDSGADFGDAFGELATLRCSGAGSGTRGAGGKGISTTS